MSYCLVIISNAMIKKLCRAERLFAAPLYIAGRPLHLDLARS